MAEVTKLERIGKQSAVAVCDIVFIHGLSGDGRATWQNAKNSAGNSWLEWTAETFPDAVVWTVTYDAAALAWLGSAMPISERAKNLLATLEARGIGRRPLAFVTHSMGGLIVKKMMQVAEGHGIDEFSLFADFTKLIVFVSVPHHGSSIASYLDSLRIVFRPSAASNELQANEPALSDLNEWFRNFVRSRSLRVASFHEEEKTKGVLVVSRTSADFGYPGHTSIGETLNHIEICKPKAREGVVFERTEKLLKEFVIQCQNEKAIFVEDAILPINSSVEVLSHNRSANYAKNPTNSSNNGTCIIRFADGLRADLVACQISIHRLSGTNDPIKIVWPSATIDFVEKLRSLIAEVPNYHQSSSIFYGVDPEVLADFVSSAKLTLDWLDNIQSGAGEQARRLVKNMLPYWTNALDNIIARTLMNFLTLCNYEMLRRTIYYFRFRQLYDKYFPKDYEDWFSTSNSMDIYRDIYLITEELCSAKLSKLSGHDLQGVYFWGPRSELIASARWQPGDAITTTWFHKYLIPQNELRLLEQGSHETFRYDEKVEVIKVVDNDGTEIA